MDRSDSFDFEVLVLFHSIFMIILFLTLVDN